MFRLCSVLVVLAFAACETDLPTALSDIFLESRVSPPCVVCHFCPKIVKECSEIFCNDVVRDYIDLCPSCTAINTICATNCDDCWKGKKPAIDIGKRASDVFSKMVQLIADIDMCTLCSICTPYKVMCDKIQEIPAYRSYASLNACIMRPTRCGPGSQCHECPAASLSEGLETLLRGTKALALDIVTFMHNMGMLDRCKGCKVKNRKKRKTSEAQITKQLITIMSVAEVAFIDAETVTQTATLLDELTSLISALETSYTGGCSNCSLCVVFTSTCDQIDHIPGQHPAVLLLCKAMDTACASNKYCSDKCLQVSVTEATSLLLKELGTVALKVLDSMHNVDILDRCMGCRKDEL